MKSIARTSWVGAVAFASLALAIANGCGGDDTTGDSGASSSSGSSSGSSSSSSSSSGGGMDATTDTGPRADTGTDAKADTTTGADTGTDAKADTGTSADTGSDARADTGTPADGGSDARADTGTGAETGGDTGAGGEAGGDASDGGTADANSDAPDDAGCPANAPVRLTVQNYLNWCNVAIGGGTLTRQATTQMCVAAGSTSVSASAVIPTFELGPAPWHATVGDADGGDPGTITGTGDTAVSTAMVNASGTHTCAWVCCPFSGDGGQPAGSGCTGITPDPCVGF